MGLGLVTIASKDLGFLDGRAFKVLIRMASMALDTPNEKGQPANLYFGGWENLAQALGFKVPNRVSKDDPDWARVERRRKKLMSLVNAALISIEKPCLDPGDKKRNKRVPAADDEGRKVVLITRKEDPRDGRRQVIELHPEVWSKVALRHPVSGYLADPNSGDQEVPGIGVQTPPLSGDPRSNEDGWQDPSSGSTTHPGASTTDRGGESMDDLDPVKVKFKLSPETPHDYEAEDDFTCKCGTPASHACHRSSWKAAGGQ